MEGKNGKHKIVITDKLVEQSSVFSFVQAVRLLIHHISQKQGDDDINDDELLEKYIRIRPELSLRFPGTDITEIEKIQEEPLKYLVTATFLGLYGTSSPLPTFYTEDLIDEFNEEKSIKRDFLDIINYRIYPLFFKIWSKYRLFYKICEENDQKTINMLYSLMGLEDSELRKKIFNIEKYFRYIGLTIQFPRSAEGLESMISDGFNLRDQISIVQCVSRKVLIPSDQLSLMGLSCCTLGTDAVIGKEIIDISGKFQIEILDANADNLHSFLPDQTLFLELKQMVEFYVDQPLKWELVIELSSKNVETAQPGNEKWSNLGWNTWLFSENQAPDKVKSFLS